MRYASILFTVLFLFLTSVPQLRAADDIDVDASISHTRFPLDRAARLTITVNGAARGISVQLPEVENLRYHSRGQSSQINMINGNVSSSVSYNYLVQAMEPGSYTIPPVTVSVGGNEFVSKAIDLEVTAPGAGSKNNSGQGRPQKKEKAPVSVEDIAFLQLSETGPHYPGEVVPVTLKLYLNQKYRTEVDSLPQLSGDGVVVEQLSSRPERTQERIGNELFHVLTWNTSLVGIKEGEHPVEFTMDATLLIPQRRRSSFSQFGNGFLGDSLLDDFFTSYQQKPITISSKKRNFTVSPLPQEGKPENFTGAVGNFELNVIASPTTVDVGEPITLTMTISGKGNFDRVEAPVLPKSTFWKSYTPASNFEEGTAPLTGRKIFEQALVIKSDTVDAVPPIEFSYFDSQQKKYITKSSRSIPLSVNGGSLKNSGSQGVSKPQQKTVVKTQNQSGKNDVSPVVQPHISGLAPIKIEPGVFREAIVPICLTPWYLAVVIVLCLLILAGLVLLFLRRRQHRNPDLQRKKSVKKQLQMDLDTIKKFQEDGDAAGFLSACRAAIQNQMVPLTGLTASAISRGDMARVADENSAIFKIFTLAEESVYAGATLSTSDMMELFSQLQQELEALNV